MDNEFYTNEDIQILTGKDYSEVKLLIENLNKQLKDEFIRHHLRPLIQKDKILKDYFIKKVEVNL